MLLPGDGCGNGIWHSPAVRAGRFPGFPLVGYEQEDDLQPALDCGFTVIGELRVWLQG